MTKSYCDICGELITLYAGGIDLYYRMNDIDSAPINKAKIDDICLDCSTKIHEYCEDLKPKKC